jgi:hypothetical protein
VDASELESVTASVSVPRDPVSDETSDAEFVLTPGLLPESVEGSGSEHAARDSTITRARKSAKSFFFIWFSFLYLQNNGILFREIAMDLYSYRGVQV